MTMATKALRNTSGMLGAVLLASMGGGCLGQTSLNPASQIVTDPRPLAEVATLLEGKYAKVVTYEDPVWVWRSDVQTAGQANPTEK